MKIPDEMERSGEEEGQAEFWSRRASFGTGDMKRAGEIGRACWGRRWQQELPKTARVTLEYRIDVFLTINFLSTALVISPRNEQILPRGLFLWKVETKVALRHLPPSPSPSQSQPSPPLRLFGQVFFPSLSLST